MSSNDLPSVSQTVYRIPKSHWHCRLRNFEWEEGSRKREALESFIDYLDAGESPPPHMLMTGNPGLGKSHLLFALYRWAVKRTDTRKAFVANLPSFCNKVKSSYDSGGDPFEQIKQAEFFVGLDDLFGKHHTDHEIEQIISPIIDAAYMNGAALVITTNWSLDDLQKSLHPHEISRILENCQTLKFSGKDRRIDG